MNPPPLSPRTQHALTALFGPDERADVKDLLIGEVPPPGSTPAGLERVRLAVLKVSGGNLDHLLYAIDLAQTDWRDLLMAAGFGADPNAHKHWHPGRQSTDASP